LKFQFHNNYADHTHVRITEIETVETVTYILRTWMKVPWTDASTSPSTCASAYCSIFQPWVTWTYLQTNVNPLPSNRLWDK
jgi:hypothetical protein